MPAINTATAMTSLKSGELELHALVLFLLRRPPEPSASGNSQFSRIALPIEGCHSSMISSSTAGLANSSG